MSSLIPVETIVAVATPPGRGGVGIVRLSGPRAYAIACQVTSQTSFTPRHAHFCAFSDLEGSLLDEGLVLYFKAPHSFTGEDVVELHGHGSPILLDDLVKTCVHLGARLARPGEFSERAFLNNKLDLVQAEAIADLIQASSHKAARLAVRSLQGDFSKKITTFNESLLHLRMYVEAAIDFPEEEIDFLKDGKISHSLDELIAALISIEANALQGALLREGLTVVIAGRPNAGKSTLINALAGKEVAIVTDIEGTTRDVMREHILMDDIPLHVVDTAGLRDSDDAVEKEGIKRAWDEVKRADCLLFIMDASQKDESIHSLAESLEAAIPPSVPVIRVFNKIDKLAESARVDGHDVYLSAKTEDGLAGLKQALKCVVGYQAGDGQFLARRRHLQALSEAKALLLNGQEQLRVARALELLAEDLRLAHQALGEITGEFSSDDLLGQIFSSFCIGK